VDVDCEGEKGDRLFFAKHKPRKKLVVKVERKRWGVVCLWFVVCGFDVNFLIEFHQTLFLSANKKKSLPVSELFHPLF
jgi:hypothetical protein